MGTRVQKNVLIVGLLSLLGMAHLRCIGVVFTGGAGADLLCVRLFFAGAGRAVVLCFLWMHGPVAGPAQTPQKLPLRAIQGVAGAEKPESGVRG